MVASNDDLARIHQRAKVGERLEPDDFEKYTAFLLSYFAWLEDVYVQQQSGLFAIKLGHGDVVDFMEPQFSTFLNSPQLKEWVLGTWTGFSPDFVARLTEILGPQTQADNAGTGTGA